jgi:hypothetical protein
MKFKIEREPNNYAQSLILSKFTKHRMKFSLLFCAVFLNFLLVLYGCDKGSGCFLLLINE